MDETKLKEMGLLIDPDNLDPYLDSFEYDESKDFVNSKEWEDKRVFVTGTSGFVGSHLIEKLLEVGSEIQGMVRRHSVPEYPNITHIMKHIELVEGNLTDFDSILAALNDFEPHVIFHLGAQSFVPTSFRSPIETYQTNVVGTANVLEAVRRSSADIEAIQITCSSEEYGLVYPNEVPIKETNPLRPQSPYAVSKLASDVMAQTHYKCYGTPAIITRGFNHTGPRRGLQFVTSVVSRQIAKCMQDGSSTVTIGNPKPIRDLTDVRDMVQGYMLAVEKGKYGEPYNFGSGYGISMENLVKLAANLSGIDVDIKIDERRFRPAEVQILICDYGKAKKELGYNPRIPLTKAVSDNIEYFKNNPHLLDIDAH